jgi:hypothetical protein
MKIDGLEKIIMSDQVHLVIEVNERNNDAPIGLSSGIGDTKPIDY